jgi:hypothetical protein
MKSDLKVLVMAFGIVATSMGAMSAATAASSEGRCYHSRHCFNGAGDAVAHRASLPLASPAVSHRRSVHSAPSPSSPQPNPTWSLQRNGDEQPVDQHGVPLPGYSLGPL